MISFFLDTSVLNVNEFPTSFTCALLENVNDLLQLDDFSLKCERFPAIWHLSFKYLNI